MHLWNNYKSVLFRTFPDLRYGEDWANWESKGTSLIARTYTSPYIIKSREVDIFSPKSSIYNNIIYPKTNAKVPTGLLPCFGMDLMGFNEKRVIIVLISNILLRIFFLVLKDYQSKRITFDSLNQAIISQKTFMLLNVHLMKLMSIYPCLRST